MDKITLTLKRNTFGQLIDLVRVQYANWQGTANVMTDDGDIGIYEGPEAEEFVLMDCSGKREAEKMAEYYEGILAELESINVG